MLKSSAIFNTGMVSMPNMGSLNIFYHKLNVDLIRLYQLAVVAPNIFDETADELDRMYSNSNATSTLELDRMYSNSNATSTLHYRTICKQIALHHIFTTGNAVFANKYAQRLLAISPSDTTEYREAYVLIALTALLDPTYNNEELLGPLDSNRSAMTCYAIATVFYRKGNYQGAYVLIKLEIDQQQKDPARATAIEKAECLRLYSMILMRYPFTAEPDQQYWQSILKITGISKPSSLDVVHHVQCTLERAQQYWKLVLEQTGHNHPLKQRTDEALAEFSLLKGEHTQFPSVDHPLSLFHHQPRAANPSGIIPRIRILGSER
jgi:hypothetical protein